MEEEDDGKRQEDDNDDDARSVSTVVPHEFEQVEEEDEEQLTAEEAEHNKYHSQQQMEVQGESDNQHDCNHESKHIINDEAEPDDVEDDKESCTRRSDELGRLQTPKPSSMGLQDMDAYNSRHRCCFSKQGSFGRPNGMSHGPDQSIDDIDDEPGSSAHSCPVNYIHTQKQGQGTGSHSKGDTERSGYTATITTTSPTLTLLPRSMEGQWSSVWEDWNKECERLNQAREEWENKVQTMDTGLERLATLQSAASAFQQQQQHQQHLIMNGDAMKHIGLVTPPSPRSLFQRRGQLGQRSRSGSGLRDGVDTDTDATLALEEMGPSKISALSVSSGRSAEADDEEEGDTVLGVRPKTQLTEVGVETLATPDFSVYKLSRSGARVAEQGSPLKGVTSRVDLHAIHIQTAIGMLVLSVAAAAVIWQVKPET